MAGTALAIRLYDIDHGRRPEQLSALVPKYLPVVPVDPFSAQSWSIRYRPDIERPLLYSVGYDGQDDDGTVIILKDGRRDREEKDDIVFYLEGKPGPEPDGNSSSLLKTRENDRDGKNGQGEPDKNQAGKSQPQAGQTDRKPKRPAS